jgi:hypothetical protein
VNPEKSLKTAATGVRRVEGSSTLECVRGSAARSASRSFLKDLKSWESLEGFEPSKGSKEGKRPSTLENLKEGVATLDHRRTSS